MAEDTQLEKEQECVQCGYVQISTASDGSNIHSCSQCGYRNSTASDVLNTPSLDEHAAIRMYDEVPADVGKCMAEGPQWTKEQGRWMRGCYVEQAQNSTASVCRFS